MPASATAVVGDTEIPVTQATSVWSQARGFRGRLSAPNYGLAITFDDVQTLTIDMVGVGFPLTVAFIIDERVQSAVELAAWTGLAPRHDADTVLEVPPELCKIKPGMEVAIHA